MRTRAAFVIALLISILASKSEAADSGPRAQAPSGYTIAVLGDSLGEGLWESLYRSSLKEKGCAVQRVARRSVGFARFPLTTQIEAALAKGPVQAFTIIVGVNDNDNSFFVNGRPVALFGSDEWKRLYGERVGQFMDRLGQTGTPTIWVLLPAMRQAAADRAAQIVNEIYVQEAKSRPHVHLVATREATGDEQGNYTAYLKDASGRTRLLRQPDGIHFQEAGYHLVAKLVVDKLKEVSPEFRANFQVAAFPDTAP